jgi:hypothetical protein
MLLLPLKPMAQSRRGVFRMLEEQVRPLVAAIPRFIQLYMPLPPLKPMDQSRRGVVQMLEAQVHPLVAAIPRFIQLILPFEPPHAVIEPSALRAAKAESVE